MYKNFVDSFSWFIFPDIFKVNWNWIVQLGRNILRHNWYTSTIVKSVHNLKCFYNLFKLPPSQVVILYFYLFQVTISYKANIMYREWIRTNIGDLLGLLLKMFKWYKLVYWYISFKCVYSRIIIAQNNIRLLDFLHNTLNWISQKPFLSDRRVFWCWHDAKNTRTTKLCSNPKSAVWFWHYQFIKIWLKIWCCLFVCLPFFFATPFSTVVYYGSLVR